MTISIRQQASGTFNQAATGSSTSITVAWPSATLAGSTLVAVMGVSLTSAAGTTETYTPPAGWAERGRVMNAGNSGLVVWGLPESTSRSGDETFQIVGTKRDATLTILELTSTGDPVRPDTMGAGATGTSATATTSSLAASATRPAMRLAVIANRNNSAQSSPSNGFAQVTQVESPNATAGNRVHVGIYQLAQADASGSLAMSATIAASRPWAAWQGMWIETPPPPPPAWLYRIGAGGVLTPMAVTPL